MWKKLFVLAVIPMMILGLSACDTGEEGLGDEGIGVEDEGLGMEDEGLGMDEGLVEDDEIEIEE